MLQVELENKVAVVTGGGSGIGEASALALAGQGATVVICGRGLEKLEEVAERSPRDGAIVPMQADVSEREDMQSLFDEVDARWGRLDVLFAHAGINGVWAPIDELTPEEWERTIRINLTGTFLTVRYAVPLLKRSGGGSVIITSSINGTRKFTDVGSSAYSASKGGQLSFMHLLALELAPHHIRVNAICPGSIDTDVEANMEMRNTKASEQLAHYPGGGIPLTGGAPGHPDQVADLVLFLASERASHITGSPIWIDGGQSLLQ
jgi:NAD(P)-dependent dehydrogenase (short-subunit alcohol dehydrogenase family)